VTLTFSLEAYANVRAAYIGGLEDLDRSGGDVSRIGSVASFFVSRVDTAVDGLLDEIGGQDGAGFADLRGKAAVANAKLAYRDFTREFSGERFAALRAKGARVQRTLWASTSTKNPDYSDVMYVEPLIGRDTVNTMPDATFEAFLDHGTAADTIAEGAVEAARHIEALEAVGVSMSRVTDGLLVAGVKQFADSFDDLMADIESKRSALLGQVSV
jgi:transaldolase/glucose-6-phosphate isomerase